MSAPVERMPTWAEFLKVARAQGVRLHTARTRIEGPHGKEPPIRYLKKGDGPAVIVPTLRPRDVLTPHLLSALCRTVPVDPAPFDLSLDELPPEEWP